MGFDVYGRRPKSKRGEYFRNSGCYWGPLWAYCHKVGEGITEDWEQGFYNDGWGLSEEQALKLANILEQKLASGEVKRYEKELDEYINSLPDEDCKICGGTGRRKAPPDTGPGIMLCNGCEGKGRSRPLLAKCAFIEENVRDFVAFLKDCGGFSIL